MTMKALCRSLFFPFLYATLSSDPQRQGEQSNVVSVDFTFFNNLIVLWIRYFESPFPPLPSRWGAIINHRQCHLQTKSLNYFRAPFSHFSTSLSLLFNFFPSFSLHGVMSFFFQCRVKSCRAMSNVDSHADFVFFFQTTKHHFSIIGRRAAHPHLRRFDGNMRGGSKCQHQNEKWI